MNFMRVAHTLAYSEKECFAGCSYFGLQRERILCGLLNAHTLAYSGKEIYAGCSMLILWSTAGRKEFLCGMLIYTLAYSGNEFYAVDLISVSLKKCNSLKQFVRDNEQKRRNQ